MQQRFRESALNVQRNPRAVLPAKYEAVLPQEGRTHGQGSEVNNTMTGE